MAAASLVVDYVLNVAVVGITRLTEECLSTAMSMGDRVVAVQVVLGTETEDRAAADDLRQGWERWRPDVALVLLEGVDERGRPSRVLGPAIARNVAHHSAAVVCRFRFRLLPRRPPDPAGRRMQP